MLGGQQEKKNATPSTLSATSVRLIGHWATAQKREQFIFKAKRKEEGRREGQEEVRKRPIFQQKSDTKTIWCVCVCVCVCMCVCVFPFLSHHSLFLSFSLVCLHTV